MAYWKFTEAIKLGSPIKLRGEVGGIRDYTSIHDVVDSIGLILSNSTLSSRVLNISSSTPIPTIDLVNLISEELGKPAIVIIEPPQKTEALKTFGDNRLLKEVTGKISFVGLSDMVKEFVKWHNQYEKEA
jgi:nucleoside-diphosphate-sugar epimerase